MAQTKKSTTPKTTKPKSKVVARNSESASIMSSKRLNGFLLVIFVLLFAGIGFYLLRSSSADTKTSVTIVSWNMKIDNKRNVATEVKSILKKADVIGLQEVHTGAQRDNIRKLIESDAYAVSPKARTNNTSASGVESYPIVWKQDLFYRVKEGVTGQVSAGANGLRPRYITWVKLNQRATGKQFYVVNTHMIKDVDNKGSLSGNKTSISRYTGHMQKLVALIKTLQKDNVPVFLTGDFAVDYRADTAKVSIFPKAALGAIGMQSNWQLTNLTGVSAKAKTYGGGTRLIDYVFAWNVATPISTYLANGAHGSDHYPVYLKASLSPSASSL